MAHNPVESAIAAHEAWVQRFQHLVNDDDAATASCPNHIADEHACEFGRLLDSGKLRFETPMLERTARDLHRTFHRFAHMIVKNRQSGGSYKDAADYLIQLEKISTQFVAFLRKAVIVEE